MSLLQRGGAEGQRIMRRLSELPADEITTTIVNYEEQLRGWLARLARATSLERQVADYRELKVLLQNYCSIIVLDFETRDAAEYERLKKMPIRVGSMDLKIAAIALANDATLLTRNLVDFNKISGLKAEDWSV